MGHTSEFLFLAFIDELTEKSEFLKNEKNCWRYHFACVAKPIIWGTVPDKPENQNFEKMKLVQQKKQSYDVCVLDMECNRHNFWSF